LSIEYNIAQPDGSTPMAVINASIALSIQKGPREEIVKEQVAIMMMIIIIK
jgi:hypothetical protein